MNRSIFFIEAPFQLLSAIEAMTYFDIVNYVFIIRLSNNEKNDNQLKRMIVEFKIDDKNINYILIEGKNKHFIDYIKIIYFILTYFLKNLKYEYIFIGNFDSALLYPLARLSKRNKIILLDDGIKNILIQDKFNDNYNYDLFTMLIDLKKYKNQKIHINDFKNFKNNLSNNLDKKQEILFIGTDLSEAKLISENDYVSLIENLANKNEQKIVYIPHRSEIYSKLEKIKQIKNIKIEYINYPIEFYFYYNNFYMGNVISFYTGALVSLKIIYEFYDIKFICYKLTNNPSNLDNVYKYLENYVEVKTYV